MISTQISELSILTTYLWPDYETAQAARDEYGAKIVEALRKAGAKVETKEGPVERAWFNGIDDMRALSNFWPSKKGRLKATYIKDDAYALHATGNVEP